MVNEGHNPYFPKQLCYPVYKKDIIIMTFKLSNHQREFGKESISTQIE